MGEIVNLRRARKAKQRAHKETEAAAHRVVYGLTKSAKRQRGAEGDLAERRLDAHRLAEQSDGERE